MPYLLINTNRPIARSEEAVLLSKCSRLVAEMLGKPERYVMTRMESGISMTFGGDDAPCAYVELKSLGLPEEKSADYSRTLCKQLGKALDIPAERIYIEFSSPARHLWGWNGATF